MGVLLASVLLAVCGASVGSTGFDSVLRMHGDPVAWQIVWDIRLPRTLGAWLAGALLGLSGAVAQGLFRKDVSARDVYLLIAATGYFYMSNRHTLSAFLGEDLETPDALAHWESFVIDTVLRTVAPGPHLPKGKAAAAA